MTEEHKVIIQANRLLGEFTGTLEAICMWDIPEELRVKLKEKVKELKALEICPPDWGNDRVTPISDTTKAILKDFDNVLRKFDFWCQCIVYNHPKEYSYFKVCSCCLKRIHPKTVKRHS